MSYFLILAPLLAGFVIGWRYLKAAGNKSEEAKKLLIASFNCFAIGIIANNPGAPILAAVIAAIVLLNLSIAFQKFGDTV